MKITMESFLLKRMVPAALLIVMQFFQACNQDDPEPVNEEEVISTVEVTLLPDDGGMPVVLKFYDADGENGSVDPVITVSGPLRGSTSYQASLKLLNETAVPVADISLEVEEEGNDHLVCYSSSGDITVAYDDADDEGRPLGLKTTWSTGVAGQASMTITLRHQAGTKTGECPGGGETDVEVTFDLEVE